MHIERSEIKRRVLAAIFAVLGVGAVALSGCSTVEGAGEDIGYAGDKISDTSRDVQN